MRSFTEAGKVELSVYAYMILSFIFQRIPFLTLNISEADLFRRAIFQELELTLEYVKEILKKFMETDYKQAKEDVLPIIKNPTMLDLWSYEFFCAITDNLKCK